MFVVAALATARRCDPREVPLDPIRACLAGMGHIVPSASPAVGTVSQ